PGRRGDRSRHRVAHAGRAEPSRRGRALGVLRRAPEDVPADADPARIQGDGTRRCAEPSYPGGTNTTYGPDGRLARGELRMRVSEDFPPPDRAAEGSKGADEDLPDET